jgi:hypothetical protein
MMHTFMDSGLKRNISSWHTIMKYTLTLDINYNSCMYLNMVHDEREGCTDINTMLTVAV